MKGVDACVYTTKVAHNLISNSMHVGAFSGLLGITPISIAFLLK